MDVAGGVDVAGDVEEIVDVAGVLGRDVRGGTRLGVREVNAALFVRDEVVRESEWLSSESGRKRSDALVRRHGDDPQASAFCAQETSVFHQKLTIDALRVFAPD